MKCLFFADRNALNVYYCLYLGLFKITRRTRTAAQQCVELSWHPAISPQNGSLGRRASQNMAKCVVKLRCRSVVLQRKVMWKRLLHILGLGGLMAI